MDNEPRWRRTPRPGTDGLSELDRLLAARLARRARLRSRRGGRRLAWVLGAAALAVVAAGAVAGAAAVGGRSILLGSCSLSELKPISLGANSFLYAHNGLLLGAVPAPRDQQPLQLARMSSWLPKATVAIEDRRFFQHGALDFHAIARALVADVRAGRIAEGGSTITQELVRNLYIPHAKRTFSRKLREACLAEKLAGRLTKRQILAAYLNEVFYGRRAHGAQAGAETFFSTTARRLTLPQAALLAGLPQGPSRYDPVAHPGRALARRNEVLRAMLAAGDITSARYRQARDAPLGLKLGRLFMLHREPNFFGWAEQQLVERFGLHRVQTGGLKVRTTLRPRLQKAAREAAAGVLRSPGDPAAALVAINPRSGAVEAMLGYLPDGRKMQFNLATQAHRTTGSAFKPITLATALSEGASVYSSFYGPPELKIVDPQCATNGGPWDVHNYADESAGTMNLLDATAYSVNTIFAQLVAAAGVRNVVSVAHRLGISTHLQPVCSITLGSQAITPLELTQVYATFAAGGIRHPAHGISSVHGPEGTAVYHPGGPGARVLGANAAALVTDALEGVVAHGTGTAAALDRPAAGKTGTAENYQDAWFCGYVPQLATCVWVGYPKGEIPLLGVEGFGQVFGGSLPAEIWHAFMSAAVAGLPVEPFATPTSFGGRAISGAGTYEAPPPPTTTTGTTTTTTTTTAAHTTTATTTTAASTTSTTPTAP